MSRMAGPTKLRRAGRVLLLILLIVAAVMVMFRESLSTHARVWLLLSQELPQSPLKPLHAFTRQPARQTIRYDSRGGPIVADLFTPGRESQAGPQRRYPALILALGVTLREADRPTLLQFADSLTRIGFVVLWPRGAPLDAGAWLPEEPETFVASVRYLEALDAVDPGRISMFGFSIGASIALVAASEPQIAEHVHAVVSFGGYYDMLAYLESLATRSVSFDGQSTPWEPSEDALTQARAVLEASQMRSMLDAVQAPAPEAARARLRSVASTELQDLRRLSPADHLATLGAKVYILHDQGDQYVPFVESIKLRRALPDHRVGSFALTQLFQHAQVRPGMSWQTLQDVVKLYGFAYDTVGYLTLAQ
jgi:dipeptidyl aminopeptidase/acylaminoacyl peptidase